MVGATGKQQQFIDILLCNFQSKFAYLPQKRRKADDILEEALMGSAESRREEGKGILTWEMADNGCAIKVPEERKLHRNVCTGSWEKRSNSGLIQKVAVAYQACSQLVSWGLFGCVFL